MRERPTLRVAAAQIENVVGDLEGNARRILEAMEWADSEGCDVVVFPELALTGYPLADLVLRREFVAAAGRCLERLASLSGRAAAVVGTVDRVPPRRAWDTRDRDVAISAAVLCDGEVRGRYHKVLLPNYDGFDEARTFAPGSRPDALWRIGDGLAGIVICEDMWSGDGPPELQAAAGAQILLVQNASPFHREKPKGRRALATQVAIRNGIPVVYVNSVGGQDELVFDGGSLVVGADGALLYRAAQFVPERFWVDVPLGPRRRRTTKATTVHARPPAQREPVAPPPPTPEASDDEQVWQALVVGTRDFAHKNGATTAVLGLSGGIDAAVTAAVAADALGPGNVTGIAMPGPRSAPEETDDAAALADALGIDFQLLSLEASIDALRRAVGRIIDGDEDEVTIGALAARARAAILLAVADEHGHLALATGNKSELSIGTAELHGDMAGGFAPLKDCPKTLVYRLARRRNERQPAIPERTLRRTPSARVGAAEPLPPYDVLDPIVERYIEHGASAEELIAAGFDGAVVRGVLQLIDDAEFKRRLTPPGVKITSRAFAPDRHMPITNAWRPYHADEPALGANSRPVAEQGAPR